MVSEEKMFENVDGRRTDGGRRSHWYTNSSPRSLRLRWAKNNVNMAMRLQVLPQNIPLLKQLINHKHIVNIPELLRCHTIIMVSLTKCTYGFSYYEESLILYWMTLVINKVKWFHPYSPFFGGDHIQQLIILKVIMIETRCLKFWNSQVIIFSKHGM